MNRKDKSEINPNILKKIDESSSSENVKECLKELITFEYEKIDEYKIQFKDKYKRSIEKWKKTNGDSI